MKHNGALHALSHFGSMFIVSILVGQTIGRLMGQSFESMIISMVAGGFIGWNWSKLTGFGRKENVD